MSPDFGNRGIYRAGDEQSLRYRIYDADNHIYAPQDAPTRHLSAKHAAAFRAVEELAPALVDGDTADHVASTTGTHTVPEGGYGGVDMRDLEGMEGGIPIPGAMLNRLNPMRDLDQLDRSELVQRYNSMRSSFERREPRLALMDLQGVETAVVHTGGFDHEPAFDYGGLELGAAVTRAWNEYVLEDWGFNTENRIYCPLLVPWADVDLAIREIEWGLEHGAALVNLPVAPTQLQTSPFAPTYDRVWSLIDESGLRVAIHLHDTARHDGMAAWGEDPETLYPQYDAFQWTVYWSDRPIIEMVAAMVFQNLFGRFPNVKVLIAEYGTVWLPYLLRKMDHAVAQGRRPTYGTLEDLPSSIFKRKVVVAPYPEEQIGRVAEVSGWDCLVFGSDFPHAEGLPDPLQYVAQLDGLDDDTVRKVMRDNLERFLRS